MQDLPPVQSLRIITLLIQSCVLTMSISMILLQNFNTSETHNSTTQSHNWIHWSTHSASNSNLSDWNTQDEHYLCVGPQWFPAGWRQECSPGFPPLSRCWCCSGPRASGHWVSQRWPCQGGWALCCCLPQRARRQSCSLRQEKCVILSTNSKHKEC